ncbi:MAG TPA: hypothetical protein VLM20_03025, partial [Methylophilaceae bacterium]|nr:hypothetical protein [Methylophilaceae bacterium]
MQHNLTIKHAITTALSIMAFSVHTTSFALGLSDITVQSNLGDPLKAHVNILGANDLKDASCIRLGADSNLSNVNFAVNPSSGYVTKLTLSTNKIVNEPIVNLSIIAGCNFNIRRDFVLLLDPPSFNSVTNIEIPNLVGNVDTNDISSTKTTIADNKSVALITTKEKKKSATNKKQSTSGNKKSAPVVVTKSTGVKFFSETTKVQTSETQPSLSISATSYSSNILALTGLRLDKEPLFSPNTITTPSNRAITIEDEVTVMNKRLAHLQEQIINLQQQNLKLQSENKMKSAQLVQAEPSLHIDGMLPLFGAGIFLFGCYTVYNWLRRRELLIQTHNIEAILVNMNTKEKKTADELTYENNVILSEVDFDIDDTDEDSQLIPN